MKFFVCGVSAQIDDDIVNEFLTTNKYYDDVPHSSCQNNFFSACKKCEDENYIKLAETDDYILYGAKYSENMKMFMLELLGKPGNSFNIASRHENSIKLKNYNKLMLE